MTEDGGATARLVRWCHGLNRALGVVAAVLLFLMMVLTFADVFGRYLFSRPIPGAFEVTEVMMGVLIFAGLPLISARDGHVSVNLIDSFLGPRLRRAQAVAANLVGGVALATVAYMLWIKGGQVADYGDATAYLGIPMAPVLYVMSVLSALTVVVFAVNALRHTVGGIEWPVDATDTEEGS